MPSRHDSSIAEPLTPDAENSMPTGTIFFMESSRNIGGQELQLLQQMKTLNSLGWHTKLICKPNARIKEVACQQKLDVMCLRLRNALHLPSIWAVRDQIKKLQPQALIVHSGHDAIIGAIAARSLCRQRPRIIRMRTYHTSKQDALPYNHLFDRTFACSEHMRRMILSNKAINPEKIKVLYPGIDFEELEKQASTSDLPKHIEAWLANHPGPIMLHGAMLRPEKGHTTILEAMPAILQQHPDLRYIIAGEGVERDRLEAMIQQYTLQKHVLLAGMVSPIAPLLKRSTLAILPSLSEPFGMFQIEALNLGIPTIASNTGGIPETLRHGIDGLLVEPANSQGWSKAICWALNNTAIMQERAQNGKAHNRSRFSLEKNIRILIDAVTEKSSPNQ